MRGHSSPKARAICIQRDVIISGGGGTKIGTVLRSDKADYIATK